MKKYQNWLFILGNSIVIFVLCFIGHNFFEWFPNSVTSIFFPVNESIWEHMKLIFISYFFWMILQFLFRKYTKSNNLLSTFLISAILNILLYLLLYLPVYFTWGENMIFTFIWLFVSIFLIQMVSSYLMKQKEKKTQEMIALVFIPICFALFGYLTYHPIKTELFYDPLQEKYGLSTLKNEE